MTDAADSSLDLPTPAKVLFAGNFIENATIIPTSTSTLVMATGQRDGTTVLLPFIDTRVGGVKFRKWFSNDDAVSPDVQSDSDVAESNLNQDEEDGDETVDVNNYVPLMAATLPLDNALFFAWDYVRDIQVACTEVSGLSGGRLGLEETRLAWSLHFAKLLREQSEECVAAIERLIAGTGNAPELETTV